MKYKKITLSFNYSTYRIYDTDSMNGYKKDYVNYSLGDFMIYVDFDNVDFAKEKLLKSANDRYQSMIKSII